MNGKKARQLRNMAKTQYAVGQPWEAYEKTNEHYKTYFNHLTIEPQRMPVYTSMLGACQKAFYKQLKTLYTKAKSGREATMEL